MIQKVFIVRCSHCHDSLKESIGSDFKPQYFYNLDLEAIKSALKDSGWVIINGTEICEKCVEALRSYML